MESTRRNQVNRASPEEDVGWLQKGWVATACGWLVGHSKLAGLPRVRDRVAVVEATCDVECKAVQREFN